MSDGEPPDAFPTFGAPQRTCEPSSSGPSSSTSSFRVGGPQQAMSHMSYRTSDYSLPTENAPLHPLNTPAWVTSPRHATTTGQRATKGNDAFAPPRHSSSTAPARIIAAPAASTGIARRSPTLGYGEYPNMNALTQTDRTPAESVQRNGGVRENTKAFALSYPNQLGQPTLRVPFCSQDIAGETMNLVKPLCPNKVNENVYLDETNKFMTHAHIATAATAPLSSQFQVAEAHLMAPSRDTRQKGAPEACTSNTSSLSPMKPQLPCPKGPSDHAFQHSSRPRFPSPDTAHDGVTCPPSLAAPIASNTAPPPHTVSARAPVAPLPGGPGNFGNSTVALVRAPRAEVLLPDGRSRTPSPQLSPKLYPVKQDTGLLRRNIIESSSTRLLAEAESRNLVKTADMRSLPHVLLTEPIAQALVPTPGFNRPHASNGRAPSPGVPLRSMSPQPQSAPKTMPTVGPPSKPPVTPLVQGGVKTPPHTCAYQHYDALHHIQQPTSPGHQNNAHPSIPRQQPPMPPWTAAAGTPTYAPLRYPRYDRPLEWKEARAMAGTSVHAYTCETSFMSDGWNPDKLDVILRKKEDELRVTFLSEKNGKEERRIAKRVKQAIKTHRKLLCKLSTDFLLRKQSLMESAKWMETQRQNMLQLVGRKKEEFAVRSRTIATSQEAKERVSADIDTYKAFSAEVARGTVAALLHSLDMERSNLLADIDRERRFVDISIDAKEISQRLSKQDMEILAHTMDDSTKNATRLYYKTLKDVEDFDKEDADVTSRDAELRAVEEKECGLREEALMREQAQEETLAEQEREAQKLADVSIAEYRAEQNAQLGQYRQQKADESIRWQRESAKRARQDDSLQRTTLEMELKHAEEEHMAALEDEERRRRQLHEDELGELMHVQEQMEDAAMRAQRDKLAEMEARFEEDLQASRAQREELESAVSGAVRAEERERHSEAQRALQDAFNEDKAELEKRLALELATVHEVGERNNQLLGKLKEEIDAMTQRNAKQESNFAALESMDAELQSLQDAFEVNVSENQAELTNMLDSQVQLEMKLELQARECEANTRQLQTHAAEMAESLRAATLENQVMTHNLGRSGEATAENTERLRQALAALATTKNEKRTLENTQVQDKLALKSEITSEKEMASTSGRLVAEYNEKKNQVTQQREQLANDEATMQALADKELELTSELHALRDEEARARERVARVRTQKEEIKHEVVSLDDNRHADARADYAKRLAELEELKIKVDHANSLAAKYEANQDMNELMKQQAGGFEDRLSDRLSV